MIMNIITKIHTSRFLEWDHSLLAVLSDNRGTEHYVFLGATVNSKHQTKIGLCALWEATEPCTVKSKQLFFISYVCTNIIIV